jgi:hypothetical protein
MENPDKIMLAIGTKRDSVDIIIIDRYEKIR